MATFCLLPKHVEKFKKALVSKEINPVELAEMTSEQRRDFLANYVGKENATQVNALFESKLLLKNQKAGYISWAKRVSGISPAIRRDLISRIEKMDKILSPAEEEQFLNDLASTRLGFNVTQEEAKTIFELSKKMQDLRAKANEKGIFPTKEDRLNYGWSAVQLEDYVQDLKLRARELSFRQNPIRKTGQVLLEVPSTLKSIVASLDNSFFGRQGIKTLWDVRTSHIWIKNFSKSWLDIGRELGGTDAMKVIRAEIYSRPNQLNGKYKAGNYGLDVLTEEAFPSALPEKIPVLRRLYRASQSAYNGGALRLRADLADRLITLAEKHGVNTLDPKQAQGLGHLVGSLTGRGSLGLTPSQAKTINVLFFAPKFLKANFDTLTAHQFDSKATPFTRGEARKNLLSIVATLTAILTIAKLLDPDSVDEDPRSTNFGKIKIFGLWTDLTGGMGSMIVLASRLIPSMHNGEFGQWSRSSSGKYTKLGEQGYGSRNALDVIYDYISGKFSPALGLLRDYWKGRTFDGDPFVFPDSIFNQSKPIPIQSFESFMENPDAESVIGSMILEGLGFSVSSYSVTEENWENKTSKEMLQFKDKVGDAKFKEANERYNQLYYEWFKETGKSEEYKNLSEEGKADLIKKAKEDIKDTVFKEYKFKYKSTDSKKDKKEEKLIDKLRP